MFAAAVPPLLHKTEDNPDGGLDDATIAGFLTGVQTDRIAFLEEFSTGFFTAAGELKVGQAQREYAWHIAEFAFPTGTLECIKAFSYTDFRGDLAKVDIPTLVIHGDSDAIVPVEVAAAAPRRRSRTRSWSSSTTARTASTPATPMSSTRRCWPSSPADPPTARPAGTIRLRGPAPRIASAQGLHRCHCPAVHTPVCTLHA